MTKLPPPIRTRSDFVASVSVETEDFAFLSVPAVSGRVGQQVNWAFLIDDTQALLLTNQ